MTHPTICIEIITNCALAIDDLQSEGTMTQELQEKAVTIVALLHYLAEGVRDQA